MSAYKTRQHRLVHRGRSFHLVSYEGRPADEKRQLPETPPSWYLMLGGKRWMVGPQVDGVTPAELDMRFAEWLDATVFGGAEAGRTQEQAPAGPVPLAGLADAGVAATRPPLHRRQGQGRLRD